VAEGFSSLTQKQVDIEATKTQEIAEHWLDSKTLYRMCQTSKAPALPAVPSHILWRLPWSLRQILP